MEPQWIPWDHNQFADYLSHIHVVDYNDWCINPKGFKQIDSCCGPYSEYRFVTYHNAKLCQFNSVFRNPGSERVDAFTVH